MPSLVDAADPDPAATSNEDPMGTFAPFELLAWQAARADGVEYSLAGEVHRGAEFAAEQQ